MRDILGIACRGRRIGRGSGVAPQSMEFWQDMPFRLHDRRLYVRDGDRWDRMSLYP